VKTCLESRIIDQQGSGLTLSIIHYIYE